MALSQGNTPGPANTGNDRGSRHRRIRAEYIDRDVLRYGADRGLELRGLHRETDSTVAAVGLLWAKRQGLSLARGYVERVFERYWREALNLEDERAIAALLAEIGAAAGFEAFVKGEGRAELARLQWELREMGVFEVPSYIVNGEVYLGRQHLPLIRAMLSK